MFTAGSAHAQMRYAIRMVKNISQAEPIPDIQGLLFIGRQTLLRANKVLLCP